jgi:uncharacterized membrane protein YkvA (DUF1232 family)
MSHVRSPAFFQPTLVIPANSITLQISAEALLRLRHRKLAMFKLGLLFTKFRHELSLVWAMLRDTRTPASAKLTAVLALLYVISPVDLIPDVLPILGWLDDGLVAYLLFQLAQRLLPADLLASLKQRVSGNPANESKPEDSQAK